MRRVALEGLPVRGEFEIDARETEGDLVKQAQPLEQQGGKGRIELQEVALVIRHGDRAHEANLVAHPHFGCQGQHVSVGGKPVVIELLHRPVPGGLFEPSRQTARLIAGLKDGDGVALLEQVEGGAQSRRARANDGDAFRCG